ncbi:MAG: helix-turn-helix domain-containing protein [Cellulosilyticaceae bacterium]
MNETRQLFDIESYLSLPFWIESSGISYCDGSYRICRNDSNIYIFEYVIAGTGTIIYNDQVYSPSQGDVYILKQGSTHTYFADPTHPWTKIWFNIGGPIIEPLLQSYLPNEQVVLPHCDTPIRHLFEAFFELTQCALPAPQIFNLCSLKFLEILTALYDSTKMTPNTQTELAYHIRSILDSKVQSNISLDELSYKLFYSKTYIINTFKEEFHQTPYEYLMYKKIETAKHLLCSSTFSIKYIANLLSFADAHYFSNQFKKYTGLSPKNYRLHTLTKNKALC